MKTHKIMFNKLVIACFIVLVNYNAIWSLPDRYYQLKKDFNWEEDSRPKVGGIHNNDSIILFEMINSIGSYGINDTSAVIEIRYIRSVLFSHFKITPYENEPQAYYDNYKLLNEPERAYYRIDKKWREEEAILFYIKTFDINTEDAEELLKVATLLYDNSTRIQGENIINKLVKENKFNPYILTGFWGDLSNEDRTSSIGRIVQQNIDNLSLGQILSDRSGLFFSYINDYAVKTKNVKILNKMLLKMRTDSDGFKKLSFYPDRCKNNLLEILISNYRPNDIVSIIKSNKFIIKDRESDYKTTKIVVDFINHNKKRIGLSEEDVSKYYFK
jgi:hypothetical protein